MSMGLSIQILLPLAVEEMKATGADEIEPGHFFCAALKLAEIDPDDLKDALPDSRILEILKRECDRLVELFESRRLHVPQDTKATRRRLRKLLGEDRSARRGRREEEGREIHRSAEAKAAFRRAAERGGDMDAAALVEAILAEPGERLARALAQVEGGEWKASSRAVEGAADWIAALGSDLAAIARENPPDAARLETIRKDAVCKVLADTLASARPGKPILLVGHDSRPAAEVLADLAAWVASSTPPPDCKNHKIIAIDSAAILSRSGDDSPEKRLEELFAKAAGWKSATLFFDSFHRYLVPELAGGKVPVRFRQFLEERGRRCILAISPAAHKNHIAGKPEWERLLETIHVQPPIHGFQL